MLCCTICQFNRKRKSLFSNVNIFILDSPFCDKVSALAHTVACYFASGKHRVFCISAHLLSKSLFSLSLSVFSLSLYHSAFVILKDVLASRNFFFIYDLSVFVRFWIMSCWCIGSVAVLALFTCVDWCTLKVKFLFLPAGFNSFWQQTHLKCFIWWWPIIISESTSLSCSSQLILNQLFLQIQNSCQSWANLTYGMYDSLEYIKRLKSNFRHA